MLAEPFNPPTALDVWLCHLRATKRSPQTIQAYSYACGQLLDFLDGDDSERLLSVTRREATAFASWLSERYKVGGNRSRIRSLRVFYNWAIAEGEYTGPNPFATLMPKEADRTLPTPTDDDIDAMLDRAMRGPASHRDRAVLLILADTGCRKGEIAALDIGDVDFANQVVNFRVSKTRARIVPLSDRAAVAVKRWLRQRGPRPLGGLWASTCPYELIDTIVQRASGGEWRSHALRRYFAVRWMQRGGSEASLIRLCGWRDGTMLRHYIAARADDIADSEYRRLLDL